MNDPMPDAAAAAGQEGEDPRRRRIQEAAFATFMERGFTRAGTLEIATRARVSKRELYALFGSKDGVLVSCIEETASRMRLPLDLPAVSDREALRGALVRFGAAVLREVTRPPVIALYRMAITEGERSPGIAHALDTAGRQASFDALRHFLERARGAGLMSGGDAGVTAGRFFSLLFADITIRLLLRQRTPPDDAEVERRTAAAVDAVLALDAAGR